MQATAAQPLLRGAQQPAQRCAAAQVCRPLVHHCALASHQRVPGGACQARLLQQQRGRQHKSVACRASSVKFSADMQDLLAGALARQSDEISGRIGIRGLRFDQELCTEKMTGQVAWESGIQLACHLRDLHATGKSDMRGKRILELGSGIGVAGLAAAALGAAVTLTDLGAALPLTQRNVDANAEVVQRAGGSAKVTELDWALPCSQLLAGPWDMVMGADLIFEGHTPEMLAGVFAGVLAANPGAQLLLAHHHRCDNLDDSMTDKFAAAGLEICLARRLTKDVHDPEVSLLQIVKA